MTKDRIMVVLYPDGSMMPMTWSRHNDMAYEERVKTMHQPGSRFFLVRDDRPLYELCEWYAKGNDQIGFEEI